MREGERFWRRRDSTDNAAQLALNRTLRQSRCDCASSAIRSASARDELVSPCGSPGPVRTAFSGGRFELSFTQEVSALALGLARRMRTTLQVRVLLQGFESDLERDKLEARKSWSASSSAGAGDQIQLTVAAAAGTLQGTESVSALDRGSPRLQSIRTP